MERGRREEERKVKAGEKGKVEQSRERRKN